MHVGYREGSGRKNGKVDEAIALFDKARYNGYDAPALYDSYAKVYRKGIMRKTRHDVGTLAARRDKAIKLLFAKQEAERIAKEKSDFLKANKKEDI